MSIRPSEAARILVLEDDAALSEVLCEELAGLGHATTPARTLAEGSASLKSAEFDVALLDLILPDGSGVDLLRQIVADELPTEAIVLTGFGEVGTAVEAMKLGAYDYLTKPTRLDELAVLVSRAAEKSRLRREVAALRVRLDRQQDVPGLLTRDPGMKEVLESLSRVAVSDLPVLIQGESGTGKDLVARAIHRGSPRADRPFVAINCAAVPENLLESELFGHERGAFTGALDRKPGLLEMADRGVVFLDEIGEVSAAVQAKLLRAIETKEFYRVGGTRQVRADVRVVSATARDLRAAAEGGGFRQDLYYRLNGVTLRLPPLRERPADVGLLAHHFLERTGTRKSLSPHALKTLQSYSWPGNVRELQMVIQRSAWLSASDAIETEDLRLESPQNWQSSLLTSGLTLAEMEREYIETVLKMHDGHRGRAARALGIDPKTLYNKLGAARPRAVREG
jgi:DNA-binding NtrC family response regulator